MAKAGTLERNTRDDDARQSARFTARQQRQQVLRTDVPLQPGAGRARGGRAGDRGRFIDAARFALALGRGACPPHHALSLARRLGLGLFLALARHR
ncbi:MAG TPA: hypothetical protein VMN83_17360 [Albitalea sp.]|nr:hypothetical protein [Albitalea sp.]